MNSAAFQIVRICIVIALVCVAAALATPKGRLPLALRGLAKMLGRCDVERLRSCASSQSLNLSTSQPPAWKRLIAFVLVMLAILLSLI